MEARQGMAYQKTEEAGVSIIAMIPLPPLTVKERREEIKGAGT
jgi:hypothetical protein